MQRLQPYLTLREICQNTAQKMKFFIKDFQTLQIWSHLLKKYLMENFIFCAVECGLEKIINLKAFLVKMMSHKTAWLFFEMK